jgi:hypothetical protein
VAVSTAPRACLSPITVATVCSSLLLVLSVASVCLAGVSAGGRWHLRVALGVLKVRTEVG